MLLVNIEWYYKEGTISWFSTNIGKTLTPLSPIEYFSWF